MAGKIFAIVDAEAVDGVRDHPEREADQGVRHKIDGEAGHDAGENGAVQENCSGRVAENRREEIIGARRDEHSDERPEIRRGDDAAFVFGLGAGAESRRQSEPRKILRKTEESEKDRGAGHGVTFA